MKLAFKHQMMIVTISCMIACLLFIGGCLYLIKNVDRLYSNSLMISYVEVMSKIFIVCSLYGIIYTVNNYRDAMFWFREGED